MERRIGVRSLGALLVIAALTVPLCAQTAQILLPLTLNEVAKGEVSVIIRGEEIFVRPSDLERAGLTGDAWHRALTSARLRSGAVIDAGGTEYIALSAFSPDLTFEFDEANLALSIAAAPAMLAPTSLSIAAGRPKEIVYSKDTSTFFNYSATIGRANQKGFFGETGTSIGGNLLLNSFAKSPSQGFARLMSSYTIDDRQRLRRFTLGDANVSSDSLGASALVGGVTVSRNFNLDPYFVRFPGLNFRGTALTPSRVDVYVNGAIVSQKELPPGPFELRDIPVSAGSGNAQIVVRDAFGREQTMATPFYYSTEVLAKGISEYVYSAGFLRKDFGRRSFSYGDPALAGVHRIGLTEDLTVGGRVELSRGVISAGPRASKRTRFGDFGAAVAFSSENGHTGSAAELGYRYLGRRFSFGGTGRLMTNEYANLTLRRADDRPTNDSAVFITLLTGHASLSLVATRTTRRDSPGIDTISALTNMPVGKRASLFVSVGSVNEGAGRRAQAFAGLSFLLGSSTTANLSVEHREGKARVVTDVQKAIGARTGYGYHLQAAGTTDEHNGLGSVEYQNEVGRYEVNVNPFDRSQGPTLTASGGVVYEKGAFVLTRAVQDSFAVVRVPGVKNVRVYASNIPVGRTDDNGNLLVPNLLSYYGNRLSIDDRDIPLNYEVQATERMIAPPYRGGAFVEFPVRQIRSVTGSLVIASGEVPAYGELTVSAAGESFVSPLGRNGEFYLENVPAGSHPATIDYKLGACSFTLTIPPGKESVVKLGRISCTP
jgi:outer membrane usher protein